MSDARIHGYILAGGRSSRMGTDKALLSLGGIRLLDRVISLLAPSCRDITLVGRPEERDTSTRAIPDQVAAFGPVGGVFTALADLAARDAHWALFVPVDVPLLPAELLQTLVLHWTRNPHTRIAFPIVDGRPQPAISLVHVTALASLQRSVQQDLRRLRPALETAAAALAMTLGIPLTETLRTPELQLTASGVFMDGEPLPWQPSPRQWATKDLWFANLNAPHDLARLEQRLSNVEVSAS